MKILGILSFKGCSVISKLNLLCLTVQINLNVNSIFKFCNSTPLTSKEVKIIELKLGSYYPRPHNCIKLLPKQQYAIKAW
ncbi:unnamed protein product, partial [Vitis vinifera]|uniref:Uncharacterized protein n=1 Tax=Vitis vinifera TaxID=29760 RepID=D7U6P9_VITVI